MTLRILGKDAADAMPRIHLKAPEDLCELLAKSIKQIPREVNFKNILFDEYSQTGKEQMPAGKQQISKQQISVAMENKAAANAILSSELCTGENYLLSCPQKYDEPAYYSETRKILFGRD
ncbi:MAG: hypothetical protein LBH05_08450 [Deferribacteraceae bacterium]|jgi:hypothetical protein|nr:hypothetical protein [Deferribacteraceae bacterium]